MEGQPMSFVFLLISLLSASREGSNFEKNCYQKAFTCVAHCAAKINPAARDSCVNSCEGNLESCLD
jgi:hypothetical protein